MKQSEINKALIKGNLIEEIKREERNRDFRLLLFIILFCTIFIGFYCLKVDRYEKQINNLEHGIKSSPKY